MAFTGHGPSGSASVAGLNSDTLLAIGGNVGEGLVVAGAVHAAQTRNTFEGSPSTPDRKATALSGQLGVLVDWFPDPTGGWHAGGLVGLGVVGISDADIADSSGVGLGAALFGGYDFWIGPQWSLGVGAIASTIGTTTLVDAHGDKSGYDFSIWSVALASTFTLH